MRGGISARALRTRRPARSSSLKRAASVFGLIDPSRFWSSVCRSRPWFARGPTISTDHFFATAFSPPSSRCGHMSPGERTRAHPGTTGRSEGPLSFREVTPRRLRGTDKYFPMDSGFDETQQEGTAGASVAAASERKVPTLSAVEDLDGLREGSSGTDMEERSDRWESSLRAIRQPHGLLRSETLLLRRRRRRPRYRLWPPEVALPGKRRFLTSIGSRW